MRPPKAAVLEPRCVRGQPGGPEQVNETAEGADANDGNCPSQLGQETDAIVAGHEAYQAEQVEGNHEQDAEQDRNQHGRGRKSLHTRNITEPDGIWLDMLIPLGRTGLNIMRGHAKVGQPGNEVSNSAWR